VSFGLVIHSKEGQKGIGDVAVLWLSLSWISTIILGVPISGAVFGDLSKGKTYRILAGVSSFIFQLPLQLFFLECHLLIEQQYLQEREKPTTSDLESPKESDAEELSASTPNDTSQTIQGRISPPPK
jgi:hypothetical protein